MAAGFDWDLVKDAENIRKHRVSFGEAQAASLDAGRLIAPDALHSGSEPRFYCIGKVGANVLTVRFTYRRASIRIIGAGYWRRGAKLYETHQVHRRTFGAA